MNSREDTLRVVPRVRAGRERWRRFIFCGRWRRSSGDDLESDLTATGCYHIFDNERAKTMNSEKQKGRKACGHPPLLRLGVGEDRFTESGPPQKAIATKALSPTGLILAKGLQRFVAQHPEVAVQRMFAFQECKDRIAPRRQLGHGDVQANVAPGIFHS